jgi:hypothetical protein
LREYCGVHGRAEVVFETGDVLSSQIGGEFSLHGLGDVLAVRRICI